MRVPAWVAAGQPVTAEVVMPDPVDYPAVEAWTGIVDADAVAEGVGLGATLVDSRAHERFRGPAVVASPGDQGVLAVRAQEHDVVRRDEAQRLADLRADPAQRRRGRRRRAALHLRDLRGELLQQRFGVRRRLRERIRRLAVDDVRSASLRVEGGVRPAVRALP